MHDLDRLLSVLCVGGNVLSSCEIVVVANACGPETIECVKKYYDRLAGQIIKCVVESRLGLHNARHAGARAASGELLMFTDDDAEFGPETIMAYIQAFAEHPEMVAAGGPVLPKWETEPPGWLLEYIDGRQSFGMLSLRNYDVPFSVNSTWDFYGVNMAIRRDTLFGVGGFNPESYGPMWLGDGETGLLEKLYKRNSIIGYVPEAMVYHHIPATRMTPRYLRIREANQGACHVYARYHYNLSGRRYFMTDAWNTLSLNISTWIRALVRRNGTDRKSLDVQAKAASTWSEFTYLIRLCFSKELRKLVAHQDWLNDDLGGAETEGKRL